MDRVRTRIAPSPTGQDLHIGNAYTALINFVFARSHDGQFIVRIEDTDRTRFVPGSEKQILASLSWLGISFDQGPYHQSERLDIYKKHAEELVEKGYAYYCYCTPERLAEMRKRQEANLEPPMYDGTCRELKTKKSGPHVVRLKVPREGVTTFRDVVRGEISFENKLIDDQVILKSDGYPTYHLGVVVDDHVMEISHVIRGEEWISSTPKHILLYQFFGWEPPVYAHMPLLRNSDKSKLSKRKNPVWVSHFRLLGILPEAMRNYLASLAWSYPEGKDIFSTEEMIDKFDLSQIQTTAPVFDLNKLRWMNGEYMRQMDQGNLADLIAKFYGDKYPKKGIKKVLSLVVERMKILAEFDSLAGFFFEKPKKYERPVDKKLLVIAKEALESSDWTHDGMEKAIRDASVKAGVKARDVFMELRVATTGKTVGPPLLESLEILGKDETISRLSM